MSLAPPLLTNATNPPSATLSKPTFYGYVDMPERVQLLTDKTIDETTRVPELSDHTRFMSKLEGAAMDYMKSHAGLSPKLLVIILTTLYCVVFVVPYVLVRLFTSVSPRSLFIYTHHPRLNTRLFLFVGADTKTQKIR